MYRFGFVMEQMLGHITHHQNLERWATEHPEIEPTWMPILEKQSDIWEKFPIVRNNWSLKASLRATRQLRENSFRSEKPFDVLFLHTQTTALFAADWMKKIPSIVSIDATPINYDTVGEAYGHNTGNNSWLEDRKYHWHRSTFLNAIHIVSWCEWAKDSLVKDYQIPAEKISVIPPGVDQKNWSFGKNKREARLGEEKIRLLFVGGDFERKGGLTLLKAFRESLYSHCELDIVTRDEKIKTELTAEPGLRIHTGLKANSETLKSLYECADIFVFPTEADCLPVAVMEAMMAGLPVITTNVGAISEEVKSGENGVIIQPKDPIALGNAVLALAKNDQRRRSMGVVGREIAEKRFDAAQNYGKIFDLMKKIAKK